MTAPSVHHPWSLRRLAPRSLLIPLVLAGCAHSRDHLSEASGAYRPLNVGQWTPTRDDLRGPRAPLTPADSMIARQGPSR